MRGHIVKRYENSYSIVNNLGKDPATGRRKQQWYSVKGNKKTAEKRLAELLHEQDTGSLVKPSRVTIGQYLETWLSDYAKINLSPRGFERYQAICRQHLIPAFGYIALTQLRPEHLQKHYTATLDSGLSARTIRYHHAVIHKALQTALEWGILSRNVADAVRPPKAKDIEMQTWDEFEVSRFLEIAQASPYFALFHTALYTGMRRSELLGLQWQDLDFLFSQVSVNRSLHHLKDGSYVFTQPKSAKSRRNIALSPSAILVLREHREKQDTRTDNQSLVFCQPDGKPLRPNTVTRTWQTIATRAGLKNIRLHDARHTHASLMLRQGVHPKIVQERLGHSSIAITLDIYSHVVPGLQEAAANRFDELITKKEKVSIG